MANIRAKWQNNPCLLGGGGGSALHIEKWTSGLDQGQGATQPCLLKSHKATDTLVPYTPVSQEYGHRHNSPCAFFFALHRITNQTIAECYLESHEVTLTVHETNHITEK